MREILFRGKRIDNGEWVYGSFCMDALEQTGAVEPGVLDGFIRRFDVQTRKMVMHEVDRETVGQYTGLTDKNGKKIFEEDVLHVHSDCCDYDFRTSVGAKYGYVSGFYVDGSFDGGDFNEIGFAMDYWNNEDTEVEVIGNIHDNLELIGGVGMADYIRYTAEERLASTLHWIPVEEGTPDDFVSVLGHMTDAGPFPSVRECYCVGGEFFFPALREYHPVDRWAAMPGDT